jgi:hypothetical protein
VENRRPVLTFGIVALTVTMADTIRLFLRAGDYSGLALFQWGAWAVWLLVPFAWTIREINRPKPLDPTPYLVFGYGTAGFALRIAQVCLHSRP